MELRRSTITVDGLASPVVETGEAGASEAVVFVHGSPGCGEEFAPLLLEAGAFSRAIALDMPGFGQASKPSPRDFLYEVPNMGVHLAQIVTALGVERVHYVGHDFGGAWAMTASAFDPFKTASISMINSGLMRGVRWHYLARIYRTPILGELFMAVANESGIRRTLSELPPDEASRLWKNFDRDTRRAILALYRATDIQEQAAQLPQIRLIASQWPAIVVFGAEDAYLPARYAERNKESLVNASVHLLEGLGHWPHLEDPAAVSELLMPFLRSVRG